MIRWQVNDKVSLINLKGGYPFTSSPNGDNGVAQAHGHHGNDNSGTIKYMLFPQFSIKKSSKRC